MVTRAPGRTRPVNVDISLHHKSVLERLARATNWTGDVSQFQREDNFNPGSPSGEWCVDNPGKFAVEYLWSQIFSKFDDGDKTSALKKEKAAMAKFVEAEDLCAKTNTRLGRLVGLPSELAVTEVEHILVMARQKIKTILGPLKLDRIEDGFTFTTGASTRLPRREGGIPYKYSGTPETTYGNIGLAYSAISRIPAWKRSLTSEIGPLHLKLVQGNNVITVPKNYKQNRVIAVEPDMNMYVQKGFGVMIRRRLQLVGNDLRTQERNQRLARVGSIAGTLATIDLSMASDTVSLELVRLLLPTQWCKVLEQCRSAFGVLPSGEKVLYRKFSSMGNGNTFELETLLFLGLALAVCCYLNAETHRVMVYGDDIIVPSVAAPLLISVLEFCGFKTNSDKTFIEGPFRESCGKHYLNGDDVTPFYVKNNVKTLSDLFLFHNKISRWATRQQWNSNVDQLEIRSLLLDLRRYAPSHWRKPRIPDGVGDGAFIGSFDECTPRVACTYRPGKVGKRDGWEGYICQVLVEVAPIADFHEEGYGFFKTVKKERKFFPVSNPPDIVGRLLQSISSSHDDDLGGVSMTPRLRLIDTVVAVFP